MDRLTRTLDELQELYASGFDIEVDELRPALARSDAWWDLLLNSMRVGLVVLDRDARVIAVNAPFAALLGRTEREIRRLGMAGLTHPDDVKADADRFVKLMSGSLDRYEVEKRYVKGDGTLIWGRARMMALRDDSDEVRFSVAMIEDITQARLATDFGAQLKAERSGRARALELNDLILQGLVVIKWALARDDREIAEQSVEAAIAAAKDLVDKLLEEPDQFGPHVIVPRDLAPPISLRLDEDR